MSNCFSPRSKIWLGALGCLGLLALCSCSFLSAHNADMVIVDPKNATITPLPHSTFRQVVVQLDEKSSSFSTITLDADRKNALLRHYDMKGVKQNEVVLPKFKESYAGSNDYSFSPDGKLVAYKAHEDLKLLDISTNQERIVLAGSMPKYGRALLRWRAENQVLLVSEVPSREGEKPSGLYRIAEVNIVNGSIKELHPNAYLKLPASDALSPRGDRLAIQDAGKQYGFHATLSILDLSSGKVSYVAGTNKDSYYGAISWRPDGRALGFIENGNIVKIWEEETRITRELLTVPKGHIIYGLIWADDLIGYYSGNPQDGRRSANLIFVDANTGISKGNINIYVNGRLFYSPKFGRLIAEVN